MNRLQSQVFALNWKKYQLKKSLDLKSTMSRTVSAEAKRGDMAAEDDQASETEEEESSEAEEAECSNQSARILRDCSKLKKPDRYNRDFVMSVASDMFSENAEPGTFTDAINGKDKDKWQQAMESEIGSLAENDTWSLVELPQGRKAITCK